MFRRMGSHSGKVTVSFYFYPKRAIDPKPSVVGLQWSYAYPNIVALEKIDSLEAFVNFGTGSIPVTSRLF